MLRVEPDPAVSPRSEEYWSNRPIYTWVQQADIAADVFVTDDELLVWVTDLLTGEPLADATVETFDGRSASTDDGGIVRIPLDSPVEGLTATIGDRTVMVPAPWFNAWDSNSRFDQDRWYVIDDRGIYRPGETVRVTGLIRELTADDLQLAAVDGPTVVRYAAFDAQGAELGGGTTELNALGGFNFTLELTEAANTGQATIGLELVETARVVRRCGMRPGTSSRSRTSEPPSTR